MKRFFLAILLLSTSQVFSQVSADKRARNSLSLGFSGISRSAGLSFDHIFAIRGTSAFAFIVGFPFSNKHTFQIFPNAYGLAASGGLGWVYGERDWHFALELNYGIGEDVNDYGEPRRKAHSLRTFIGARYQKPEGGLFLKIGLSPGLTFERNYAPEAFLSLNLEVGITPRKKPYENLSEKVSIFNTDSLSQKPLHRLYVTASTGSFFAKIQPHRPNHRQIETKLDGLSSDFSRSFRSSRIGLQVEWKFIEWMSLSVGTYFGDESYNLNYQLILKQAGLPTINYFGELDYNISNLYIPLNVHFDIGRRFVLGIQMGPYYSHVLKYQAEGNIGNVIVSTDNLSDISETYPALTPYSTLGFNAGFRMRIPIGDLFHFAFAMGTGINRDPRFPAFRIGTQWKNMELGLGFNLF